MEFILIWGASVAIGCLVGEAKGQAGAGALLSIFLGPLGVLILLAMPNLVKQREELQAAAQRQQELKVQQQMLEELKALRAEKTQRQEAVQPPPVPPTVIRDSPPERPAFEDFVPENLKDCRKRVPRR